MDHVNVVQEKWDYLIILDACRYDYFESMYQGYLQGDLQKRISAGSCTNDWRDANFPDKYDDIVYISANPFFAQNQEVIGYNAGEHFHKVYELWKDGWQRGTVPPNFVTDAVPSIIKQHQGKRFVVHYLQPHAPYLILGDDAVGYETPQGKSARKLAGQLSFYGAPKYKRKMFKWLCRLFSWNSILGNYPDWYISRLLGLPPRSSIEYVFREYNNKVLRNAYRENLRLVLEQTQKLLKYLSGTIVVTSDHGELLGEKKFYAHPPKSNHPILKQVPWLTISKLDVELTNENLVEKCEGTGGPNDQSDEEQEVQDRLRQLGYLE